MTRTVGLVVIVSCLGLMVAGAVTVPAGAVNAHPAVVTPSSWSNVSSADPGPTPGGNVYDGISCVGPNFCVAVGDANQFQSNQRGIAAQWNGVSWSAMPGANPGTGTQNSVFLNSISCTSSNFCMAVGNYQSSSNNVFTEVWNGSAWSAAPAPAVDPADYANYLYGVSCTSDHVVPRRWLGLLSRARHSTSRDVEWDYLDARQSAKLCRPRQPLRYLVCWHLVPGGGEGGQ